MPFRPISRRTALKGLGVSIALPFLEAMLPSNARAAEATLKAAPRRAIWVYFANGVKTEFWNSTGEGADFKLGSSVSCFEPFRDNMLVFSNFADANAKGGGAHACTLPAYLSGTSIFKTQGNDLRAGITCDQVMAQKIGGETRFPSLELGCDLGQDDGFCDTGYSCVYQTNMSWRSPNSPAPKEVNPRIVFDRLFAGAKAEAKSNAEQAREAMNLSILDFVLDQAKEINKTVSASDKRRMDEYLTSIRDIEKRIQAPPPNLPANAADGMTRPTRIPTLFREHFRLMADMLIIALQADMTRVATLIMGTEGNRRPFPELGFTEEHHGVSHHINRADLIEKFVKINVHQAGEMAYLLDRVSKIKEGDSTLLDNSMIVYGGGMADGNAHAHQDIPTMLFGKGGGTINPGRRIVMPPNTPVCNLWLSMMDRMGVPSERFGDSTGMISQLTT